MILLEIGVEACVVTTRICRAFYIFLFSALFFIIESKISDRSRASSDRLLQSLFGFRHHPPGFTSILTKTQRADPSPKPPHLGTDNPKINIKQRELQRETTRVTIASEYNPSANTSPSVWNKVVNSDVPSWQLHSFQPHSKVFKNYGGAPC